MDIISSVSLFGVALAHPLSHAGPKLAAAVPGIGGDGRNSVSHPDTVPLLHWDHSSEEQVRLDERGKIARELHDSTSQLLVVLELQLMRLKDSMSDLRCGTCDDILAAVSGTIADLHEGVRAIGHPAAFDPSQLGEQLMAMSNEFTRRTGTVVQTRVSQLSATPSSEIAGALYRVAQEALANVSRHANASKVRLTLQANSGAIALRIADDGKGFPKHLGPDFAGQGLANMRARIEGVGGRFKIRNLSHGAIVDAWVPVRS